MTGVGRDHLNALYAETADLWNFARSDYEQAKFRATRAALSRPPYASAFELGCGNGQRARHLAPLCDAYTGMDAVAIAIETAQRTMPEARFIQDFYPCPLPEGGRAVASPELSEAAARAQRLGTAPPLTLAEDHASPLASHRERVLTPHQG